MKNINAVIVVVFMVCLSPLYLKAQSIYFSFKDGTRTVYATSDVRSVTFTNDVMNLNKRNGTVDSWNVNTISYYNYNGFASGVQEIGNQVLSDLLVYPNPTQGSINIQYQVQQVGDVIIELRDINGKLIKTLSQKQQGIGNYTITWNGTDDNGNYINSGVYLCRIIIGNTDISKKIIITNQ